MVDYIHLTLRFLHVFFGIVWIGAVAFSVMVLRVVMSRVPTEARMEVMRRLIPTTTHYVPMSAVMTIVFGAVLYLYMGDFSSANLLETEWGRVLLGSLILTLGTFAYGMVVVVGTAKTIHGHLQEEKCDHRDQVRVLQNRLNLGQLVVLALGIIITGMMVFATATF